MFTHGSGPPIALTTLSPVLKIILDERKVRSSLHPWRGKLPPVQSVSTFSFSASENALDKVETRMPKRSFDGGTLLG